MKAEFLYDVTIPDHTIVQPGTKMQKIWRMKNVGSATWSDITQVGYCLQNYYSVRHRHNYISILE